VQSRSTVSASRARWMWPRCGGRFVWQAWIAGLLAHKVDFPRNIEMDFDSSLPGSPSDCILSLKGADFIVRQQLSL
jgi:hypothetical protein